MALIQEQGVRAYQRPRIILVDAEAAQAKQAQAVLAQAGYDCRSFAEPDLAISAMEQGGADILVADLASERSTFELLRRVRTNSPETAVILLVSSPAVPTAVAAMRQGAFDYLLKPINSDELSAVVGKALEMAALRRENRVLHEQLDVASMAAAFIAESSSSRHLAAMIRRAAPANSPVLIEGESGTGKELVARMLHHWSSRAQGPFVRLSFKSLDGGDIGAGWPGELQRPHVGVAAMLSEYIERASGGTLFLDELSEARPEFQSALLRLVAEGESSRGYPRGRPSTVRIVSSTNRPLAREIAAGRVRPDLYFALNVIAIQIAPLRERKEDILPLARHFLALHAAESGRSLILTPDAEAALLAYSWPGNVRELENVIERAVVMTSGERISTEALMIRAQPAGEAPIAPVASAAKEEAEETDVAAQAPQATHAPQEAGPGDLPMEGTLQEFLDRAASIRIKRAIDAAHGNRNAAAELLGIDRPTLLRLMRRLGL